MVKKIIHVPEDKCIFSTCLIPCPHFQPLFHLSLLPHFVFLSPATLFLLPLSSSPLSGRLTRNDRAFCHGVWNTLNITCQLRDDNGWQGAECTRAMLDVLSSTHFRLCLNPIIGRQESSFLGWKSMSASLCVQNVFVQEARDANFTKVSSIKKHQTHPILFGNKNFQSLLEKLLTSINFTCKENSNL